uniref:hypothetical protein n=1 Tax=Methylomonas koyamae TaxID=702114 RepID=UPI000A88C8CC|nr:hypothetical protein [Methylomonas koyamae]
MRKYFAGPDMAAVVGSQWFKDFLEELRKQPAADDEIKEQTIDVEPRFKLEKKEDFDYYSK